VSGGGASGASGSGGGGQAGTGGISTPGQIAAEGWRWLGRVDAASSTFAWSGSGLVATVSGTQIAVSLDNVGATLLQPVIDGVPTERILAASGRSEVTLAQGLTEGEHTVELYRETESMMGSTHFLGFTAGTVTGAPAYGGRLIEVIGDSISCGYGNLGSVVHPPWDSGCGYTVETQSAYQAYSAQLARLLGAEASIVCRSGWGMYRGGDGNTSSTLPSLFDRALGEQSSVTWGFQRQPEAVLINLGTNDSNTNAGGDPGVAFETSGIDFVATVRARYPRSWIFLTIGTMTGEPMLTTMNTHIANIVTAAGDPKVSALNLTTQDVSTTGCDFHPNVAEDTRIAGALADPIRVKLGW